MNVTLTKEIAMYTQSYSKSYALKLFAPNSWLKGDKKLQKMKSFSQQMWGNYTRRLIGLPMWEYFTLLWKLNRCAPKVHSHGTIFSHLKKKKEDT